MNDAARQVVDQWNGLHVIVLGEAMLDRYLEGSSARLCPEAPVPVVAVSNRHDAPGGAANTAANVRALGARVSLLSTIGDDEEGMVLRQALKTHDVSAEHLHLQPGRRTLAKQRVVAGSQVVVRFDQGDVGRVDAAAEQGIIDRLTACFPHCDAVIVSDYAYGILTPRIIAALAELQRQWPRTIVADSRRLAAYREVGVTAVKPNFIEAMQLLGQPALAAPSNRVDRITTFGPQILQRAGARLAAVTLDAEGALLFEPGRPPYRTYVRTRFASYAAGAGDSFTAALTLALAAGSEATTATELASAAAGVVVAKERTAVCSAAELRETLIGNAKFIADRADLAARLETTRRQGRRIVLTNGCFDILHRGHVTYLSRAKTLGDVLVVGVNSDAGIRRLKGPGRPINSVEDRIHVLAALNSVDFLTVFDEDTPHELIRAAWHIAVKTRISC